MKRCSALVLLCLGFLVAGCATAPTRVDRGPIKAATFSFVDPGARAVPDFADNRARMHEMIQQAVAGQLAQRGVTQVASGGDVIVAYLVIVGDNATTTAINDYFGYTRDSSGLLKKAHQAMAIDNENPNAFQAGALLIDFIDPTTFKLLKRNYAVRPILRDATTELRQERLNEAVAEALRDLRLSR